MSQQGFDRDPGPGYGREFTISPRPGLFNKFLPGFSQILSYNSLVIFRLKIRKFCSSLHRIKGQIIKMCNEHKIKHRIMINYQT